jgi:hypothetical protein
VSSDGFYESDRSPPPAYQKVLKDIREAVSDRGRGVRSGGERPPTRGPRTTGDDLSVVDVREAITRAHHAAGNTAETAYLTRRRDQLG